MSSSSVATPKKSQSIGGRSAPIAARPSPPTCPSPASAPQYLPKLGSNEDLLIALTLENMNEIQLRAQRFASKGQEWAKIAQEKATSLSNNLIDEHGHGGSGKVILDELKDALNNADGVNVAELAKDRPLLQKYVFASSVLSMFAVGEMLGKWVFSLVLSALISNAMSYGLILIGAPALHVYIRSSKPTEYDMQTVDLLFAVGLGMLQGFNVRSYLPLTILPVAFAPFIQAAVIRYGAIKIGSDRARLIGTIAGGWIIPYFVASMATGLSLGAIVMYLIAAGASAVGFQIIMARKQHKLAVIGMSSNLILLESVIIVKTFLTFALMQTYEQAAKNSSSK